MAQNDLKPKHTSSSSEEETTSGSEDEQTSGSDSDKKPKQEPQSTNKPQPPDLSSSETEESGSDTDSDSPPKNSIVVHPKVKPTPDKMTSPPPPPPPPPSAKSKRPPPAEKNTKKPKQITTNGDSKISSVTFASSQSAPDPYSDLPPKKSAVANPNVKPAPVKMTSSTPPEKSKRLPPSPAPIGKQAKKVKQVAKKASVASSQPAPDLYSSGSESETDTDSNSNSKPKQPAVVKFIVSKPMENPESKNSRSKTKSTPVKSKNENDSKKGKNEKEGKDDESKKQLLFQRLWSEDDEIVILEGMIRYKNERNGENPIADIGAFHEFIKKLLGVDVSNTQLGDKVRRLKKKYVNNASKGGSFSKSHEQKCYELSKLIWGGETESKKKKSNSKGNGDGGGSLLKLNGVGDKDRVIMMEVDENEKKSVDISRFVQYGGRNEGLIMPEEIVKAGMELVDGNKRAELEGKWRKLKEKELELYVQRMELLKEQALVVLEAVRSSRN